MTLDTDTPETDADGAASPGMARIGEVLGQDRGC